MARVRVRTNFKMTDLARDLTRAADMRAAGEELAAKIKARTLSGTDEESRSFAPTQSGEASDLHQTGQLLDDLQVLEATKHKIRVGFRTERSAKIAALLDGGTRTMPARRFLGLPAKWVDSLVERVIRRRL